MAYTRYVTLIVTRWCNIGCSYCYEKHKSKRLMPISVALSAVQEELDIAERERADLLHVKFMGGEPFLNFGLIRVVVEWLASRKSSVRCEASSITNGTLADNEIKQWLIRYKNIFRVQLSYDGGVEQQLLNRTDKPIDVRFFLNTYPRQGVHITVSKDTVKHLSQSVLSILKLGGLCSTTVAFGQKWTVEDARCYIGELRKLASAYLSHYTDREPLPILTEPLNLVGSPAPNGRICAGGITYDVDGEKYLCHFFSPLVVGLERSVRLSEMEPGCEFARTGGMKDESCGSCPISNLCTKCYGINYLLTNSTGKRDHSQCVMRFAQVLAASEYQIHAMDKWRNEETLKKFSPAIQAYKTIRRCCRELGIDC